MKLLKSSVKYKKSFLSAIEEFRREGKWYKSLDLKEIKKDFPAFVKRLNNKILADVPEYIYWLIDKEKFIGEVIFRPKLNKKLLKWGGHIGYAIRPSRRKKGYGKKILELALKKAKIAGLKNVLLTCYDNNLVSKKIIEDKGGIIQNKVKFKGKIRDLYWIDLKNT